MDDLVDKYREFQFASSTPIYSNGMRLTDGRVHGLRLGNIFDKRDEIMDMTDALMSRIFKGLTEYEMALYTMSVLGLQGSGKTEYCKFMAYCGDNIYGNDLQILFVEDPRISYIEFDDHPYTLVVVDDAARHLGSLTGVKNDEALKMWFDVRHIKEDKSGSMTGRLMFLFNWQRYMAVHKNFRNPNAWAVCSPMADEGDIGKVVGLIGKKGYSVLQENQNLIEAGDKEARSRSMIRFSNKEINSGVGWCRSKYLRTYDPSWTKFPKLLTVKEYFSNAPEFTREMAMDKLSSNPELEEKLEIYYRANEGESQRSIALDCGLTQGRISQIIREVDDLIDYTIEQENTVKGRSK